MFGRRLKIVREVEAQAQAVRAHEPPRPKALPATGVGAEGVGYEISKVWYEFLGERTIEAVLRGLAAGGSTYLQVIDDGCELVVAFNSYVVYMNRSIKESAITEALQAVLIRDQGREQKIKCMEVWSRLRHYTRSDIAAAAMRMGVLNQVAFQALRGVRDGAFIKLVFDSVSIQKVTKFPDLVLHELEECMRAVNLMKSEKRA